MKKKKLSYAEFRKKMIQHQKKEFNELMQQMGLPFVEPLESTQLQLFIDKNQVYETDSEFKKRNDNSAEVQNGA